MRRATILAAWLALAAGSTTSFGAATVRERSAAPPLPHGHGSDTPERSAAPPLPHGRGSEMPEDARLAAFFRKYLDEELRQRPMEATRLGDHRFDDRLDDLSPRARAAATERTREALADLPPKVAYKKLTRSGQIDYEILKHSLTYSLWHSENTKPFEENPLVYNSYITDCTYELLARSTQPRSSMRWSAVYSAPSITRNVPSEDSRMNRATA